MCGRERVVRMWLWLRLRLSRRIRCEVLHFAAVVEDGDGVGVEIVVGSNAGEE